MNRLKNYLSSRALAEQYLTSAENQIAIANGGTERALRHIIEAVRYLITANNNLQSLAFNSKPKRRKP